MQHFFGVNLRVVPVAPLLNVPFTNQKETYSCLKSGSSYKNYYMTINKDRIEFQKFCLKYVLTW
jgi:hypothetical protein